MTRPSAFDAFGGPQRVLTFVLAFAAAALLALVVWSYAPAKTVLMFTNKECEGSPALTPLREVQAAPSTGGADPLPTSRAVEGGALAAATSSRYAGDGTRPPPCPKEPFSNFLGGAREFLPPAYTPHDGGDDADTVALHEELHKQSFAPDCEVVWTSWCPYGTSACFHLSSRPMTEAYMMGKPTTIGQAVVQGPTKDPFCLNSSIECFLEPTSNCTKNTRVYKDWATYPANFVPPKWEHKGYFWWVSQQMRRLFTLSAAMRVEVDAIKARIGYKHPIIGMQIRHGDSCKVRIHCWPLAMFMDEARRMKQLYGVKNIFLATDDKLVIANLSQYTPEFEFFTLDFDRSHFDLVSEGKVVSPFGFNNPSLDDCHATGQCDPVTDQRYMLIDLALMSDADYFIGAFSANGARLAYELMAARRGCTPPYISLDVPWCHKGGYAMGGYSEWQYTSC